MDVPSDVAPQVDPRRPRLLVGPAENPAPYVFVEVAVANRRLDCPRYEKCLSLAAREWWQGWSCSRCLLFLP